MYFSEARQVTDTPDLAIITPELFEAAQKQADQMKDSFVSTEHLLLALTQVEDAAKRLLHMNGVEARKEARGVTHPNQQRRPRHILSGLLRCGTCGAGMSTNGKDKSGRIRIRCSAATESGTCPDPKTFYLDTVEKAVLSGLTAEMRHPDVIAEYVRTYHEERKRLSAESDATRSRLERQLSELTGDIDRLVDAERW